MPGIGIILGAFFGLCAILRVAPHVRYEKPGTTRAQVQAKESVVDEDGAMFTVLSGPVEVKTQGTLWKVEALPADTPVPVEPDVELPPWPEVAR